MYEFINKLTGKISVSGSGWQRLAFWKKDDRGYTIETSKRGDNYYSVFKVNDEVVLAIVSPPSSFGSQTDVDVEGSASVPVTSASGKVGVRRDKNMIYGNPTILFNPNNTSGLQLSNTVSTIKSKLEETDPNQEKFKVDLNSLSSAKKYESSKRNITTGSTIIEFSPNNVILRPIPDISSDDRKTIELLLGYTVKTLYPNQQIFRANVMLYNPEREVLQIIASYNMEGYVDANIEIPLKMGGSGFAYAKNMTNVLDIPSNRGQESVVSSDKIWNKMKAVLSTPIQNADNVPIGVLNIDTDQYYNIAKFDDENLQNLLRMPAQIISRMLENAE